MKNGGRTYRSGCLTIGLKRTHYVSVGLSLFTSDRCLITTIPRDWSRTSEALSPLSLRRIHILYYIYLYSIGTFLYRSNETTIIIIIIIIIILYATFNTAGTIYYTCKCIIQYLYGNMCPVYVCVFSCASACVPTVKLVRIAIGGRGTTHLPENRHQAVIDLRVRINITPWKHIQSSRINVIWF